MRDMRVIRWLFLLCLMSYGAVYALGWHQCKEEAVKRAYKVYLKQVWNEHQEMMREREGRRERV